mmetsp:Transcript_23412/g.23367  ORF Transcript_23412/g.23367 Transcript_23412/m.23367 type:complete len:175 (+) Transcript_23412:222-746(+)
MEGEAYEAQTKGIYKSIKNAYEMGLISQIPVSEEVANNLPIEDMKNPNRLIEKSFDTFRVSRRFSVDPHNKQHLFGKGLQKEPEPINKQFFDESPFGIQNEVYPTKYVHTKSEPTRLGGGSFQKPPKSTLKTYAGTERKGYMEDRLGATMQAENIAKINFDKSQNFNDFNEKLK